MAECRPHGSSSAGAAALAGLLLAAGPAGAATHEVVIRNFAFEPPQLTIEAGDSVRWTVVAGRHSVTAKELVTAKERVFDSAELAAGVSFERRFDRPGVYPYFCTPHDFMRATVTVLPGPSYGLWAAAAAGVILLLGAATLLLRRRRAS